MELRPIKPKRIADQVFDQLRELIFRGEIKPGDKVMPERELAEILNVSRTSVRDAIRKLVVMGLLEQKQGQGTFVRNPAASGKSPLALAVETQDATLIDLLEVRMGMESNTAALAAQRATPKDIDFLEKSVEEMREDTLSGGLGTEADVSFHMALAYASKNPLQVYLMKNFFDYLFIGIKENLTYLYEDQANIDQIINQHKAVFSAVKEKNPEKAYRAMKAHIQYVIDFFKKINMINLRLQ